jgi:hypothetical protein
MVLCAVVKKATSSYIIPEEQARPENDREARMQSFHFPLQWNFDSIFFVALIVLGLVDGILYLCHPRFYAAVGVPLYWKTVMSPGFTAMSELKQNLASAFDRYAFYNDEAGVWCREKQYPAGWRRSFRGGAMTKGLIVREGGDLRCRLVLSPFFVIVPLALIWGFIFFGRGNIDFIYPVLLLAAVAIIFTVMVLFKIRDFKKIIARAAGSPDGQPPVV